MNSRRLYFVLVGLLIVLAALGVAGVVWGSNLLQKKSSQLVALKTESVTLQEQQRILVQAKKDIAQYADLEKIAKSIVPQEKDQARTVRELIKIAQESGITIATISFPTSSLGQAAPKAPAGTTTDPKAATPTTPKTTAPTTSATQIKPVEGLSGVYQMEINVQTDSSKTVPYRNLLTFLSKLEQNRRTAQVTGLTVQPSTTNRDNVTFSVVLNVYIKP